jgi:hypothetical protein
MKSLSIRQPWAWLIAAGHKNIENRGWRTDFVGRIYIHAAKLYDNSYRADLYHIALPSVMTFGAIIGEVDIVDCVTRSNSKWFIGPYGFVLSNPVLYIKPIPCKGRLGFFEPNLASPP